MLRRLCAVALLGLVSTQAAQAVTMTVGGRDFVDNSYADVLISSSGVFTTSGSALSAALIDSGPAGLTTWASSATPGASVTLGFTDNTVVNGAGDDLALFEVGHFAFEYSQDSFDTFKVTINGVTRNYFVAETTTIVTLANNSDAQYNVNMTTIDLSSFGLAAGATISQVQVGLDFVTTNQNPAPPSTPQFMMAAAINSGPVAAVPEPASWMSLFAGLGVVGAVARRRRAGTVTA